MSTISPTNKMISISFSLIRYFEFKFSFKNYDNIKFFKKNFIVIVVLPNSIGKIKKKVKYMCNISQRR